MQDITNFRIGKANYFLENKLGSKLRLTLNYGKNSYVLKILKNAGDIDRLKKQAGVVAKNLLGKKAQKNLSYKLLQLKMKV